MKKLLFITLVFFSSGLAVSQNNGPGGVGKTDGTSMYLWLGPESSDGVNDGDNVTTWSDLSGNAFDLSAVIGTGGITYETNEINGQSVVRLSQTTGLGSYLLRDLTPDDDFVDTSYTLFLAWDNNEEIESVAPASGSGLFSSEDQASVTSDEWHLEYGAGGEVAPIRLDAHPFSTFTSTFDQTHNPNILEFSRTEAHQINLYLNGTVDATSFDFSATPTRASSFQALKIGSNDAEDSGRQIEADFSEVILFKNNLTDAEEIIVYNYLSSKYDIAITKPDVYAEDGVGENYDFNVAGVGEAMDGSVHNDAQSSIVRVTLPTGNPDGTGDEFFMFGHNDQVLEGATIGETYGAAFTDVTSRLNRTWAVSEMDEAGGAAEVGDLNIRVDLSFVSYASSFSASDLVLMFDRDGDGDFTDETDVSAKEICTSYDTSTGLASFLGVAADDLDNNFKFTIGSTNSDLPIYTEDAVLTGVEGPAGIGSTDGTNLYLWARPDNGLTTSTWTDSSGSSNHLTVSGTAPALGTVNTYNNLPLNGTDNILSTSAFSSTITDESYSIFIVSQPGTSTANAGLFSTDTADTAGYFEISADGTPTNLLLQGGVTPSGLKDFGAITTNVNISTVVRTTEEDLDVFVNGTERDIATNIVAGDAENFDLIRLGVDNGGSSYYDTDIAEVIVMKTDVDLTQRILIENYLAGKFGIISGSNLDVYEGDTDAGAYDHDIAGIGYATGGASNIAAKGTGVITMTATANLDEGEFLIWGHNNGDDGSVLNTEGSEVPTSSNGSRTSRVWYVSKNDISGTADVSSLTVAVEVDMSFSSNANAFQSNDLELWIDGDGDFSTIDHRIGSNGSATLPGAGSGTFTYNSTTKILSITGLTELNDTDKITIASTNSSLPINTIQGSTSIVGGKGPGGIGDSDGSSMYLWLGSESSNGSSDGDTVTTWSDLSGNSYDLTAVAGTGTVTYETGELNGQSVVRLGQASSGVGAYLLRDLTPDEDFIDTGYTLMMAWDNNEEVEATAPIGGMGLFVSDEGSPSVGAWQLRYHTGSESAQVRLEANSTNLFTTTFDETHNPNVFEMTRTDDTHLVNLYVNGTADATTVDFSGTPARARLFEALKIGSDAANSTGRQLEADFSEVILYKDALASVHRIIVNNYLAAKYGDEDGTNISIANNKYFGDDISGSADFDWDVAGIGHDGTNFHSDSQGTGIVRVYNPTDLESGEYFMWGTDKELSQNFAFAEVDLDNDGTSENRSSQYLTNGTTDTNGFGVETAWYVSETGGDTDIGSHSISFDFSNESFKGTLDGLASSGCLAMELVIDSDDDDVFDEVSSVVSLTYDSATGIATAHGVSGLTDSDLFTVRYSTTIYYSGVWENEGTTNAPDTGDECLALVIESGIATLTSSATVKSIEVQNDAILVVDDNTFNVLTVLNGITLSGDSETNNHGDLIVKGNSQLVQTHTSPSNLNTGNNFLNKITLSEGGTQLGATQTSSWYSIISSPVDGGAKTFTYSGNMRDGSTALTDAFDPSTDGAERITFINEGEGSDLSTDPITLTTRYMSSYKDNRYTEKSEADANNVGEGFFMVGKKATGQGSQDYVFFGRPNSGDYDITVESDEYIILGNPYPSSIDANQFLSDNSDVLRGSLHFYEQTSGAGFFYEDIVAGYGTYTLSGGVAGASSIDGISIGDTGDYTQPLQYIPVGQGFFAQADTAGSIHFNNGQRNAQQVGVGPSVFFKQNLPTLNTSISSENDISGLSKLRLGFEYALDETRNFHRQLMVSFKDGNSAGYFDKGYDAEMLSLNANDAYFQLQGDYDDPMKLIIAGVGRLNHNTQVPLYVKLDETRTVSFMIDNIENIHRDVYLIDYQEEKSYNLTQGKVSLELLSGSYESRFALAFVGIEPGVTLDDKKVHKENSDFDYRYDVSTGILELVVPNKQKVIGFDIYGIGGNKLGTKISDTKVKLTKESAGLILMKIHTPEKSVTIKGIL